MKRAAWFLGCASLATAIAPARNANAVQKIHVQVNQRGDFAWIGNSSAQDCASTATAPKVGTLNKALCGTNVEDSAPDVFWRADDPGAGQATRHRRQQRRQRAQYGGARAPRQEPWSPTRASIGQGNWRPIRPTPR